MSDAGDLSAMRRKAGAGRPPPEIGRTTSATALRVAVAQAAEDVAALVALAAGVQEDRVVRDGFIDALPEHALLALCEDPMGRFGMVVMDPQALAALIEIQTTGRVVPHKAEPRAPTRTDAILAADFINRMLELFAELAAEADLAVLPVIEGFRYSLPMADTRAVSMTLEDIPYRKFTLTMDLGSGAKEGQLQLLFPFDPPRRAVDFAAGDDGDTVGDAVMDTHAQMQAVLHRLELPLTAVVGLEVGALVPVPRAALSRVTLEGVTGEEISTGRLGQVGGHRAVRICDQAIDEVAVGAGASAVEPPVSAPLPGAMPGIGGSSMPPGPGMPSGLDDLPGAGDLPPLGGEGLPPLGGGDLPPLGDLGGLPPLGGEGELPPLDIAPLAMDGLPETIG
jgi:flagellar motor switch protein FliM